ncbi:hypothetical protein [Sorangium sp. So ce1099]|uniref:hypothetical protein n=1 Tax=Sorangium sp. So ce1099 TaxID=3133331 RepID=UPI003F5F023A
MMKRLIRVRALLGFLRLHRHELFDETFQEQLDGMYTSTGSTARASGQGAVYVGAGGGAAVMPLRLGERGQREVASFELSSEPGASRRAPRGAGVAPKAQAVAGDASALAG